MAFPTGGKSVSGVDGFIEFAAKSNTSSTINKEKDKFVWDVTQIEGKTEGTGKATETAEATIYTVLDVPKDPWNVTDTPRTEVKTDIPLFGEVVTGYRYTDDKNQPWVTALEFTIETAGTKGKATPEAALSQLTTYLHTGHGLTYDTTSGAPHYGGTWPSPQALIMSGGGFYVQNYIDKTSSKVNCYDQAAAVTVFGRLLGINVQFAFSDPFGYINATTLVGGITTNNPFHANLRYSPDLTEFLQTTF